MHTYRISPRQPTARQLEILATIRDSGGTGTIRALIERFGYSTSKNCWSYLRTLRASGLVDWRTPTSASLRVTAWGRKWLEESCNG